MIIKVCGLREPDNIRDVMQQQVNWIGFNFIAEDPRCVTQIPSRAGIIPDYSSLTSIDRLAETDRVKRVGVFADDMPQTIVTRVYNYSLDLVQLNGNESDTMIRNLRTTLIPDIQPEVKIIKTLHLHSARDLELASQYEGVADYLLFAAEGDRMPPLQWLAGYQGSVPFLIDGIAPDDVEILRTFSHPQFLGVNLNAHFESAPAVKSLPAITSFLQQLNDK